MNIAVGIEKTVGISPKNIVKWEQYIRRELLKQYKQPKKKNKSINLKT